MVSLLRLALGVVVCALCASVTATASAATVVTGSENTTDPLEIRPDTDALTHDVDIGQMRAIAYIKSMPATRTVVRVTLGELARAAECSQDVGVRLFVHEYASDDWAKPWTREVQSTGNPTLTATHADLVFTIPPTTLKQGRLYVFSVRSLSPSSCRTASLRTWAHNSPTVGPGSDRCQQMPENGTFGWRMWHETGSTDAVACPDGRPIPANFSPDMPTGWLLVRSNGLTDSYVVVVNDVNSSPGSPPYCGNLAPTTGVVHRRWREYPGVPGSSEYVCDFPQFASPLGLPPADYWYHGGPWNIPIGAGAPRDVHLRLDTINYDELVRRYLPVLRFDAQANYWNASAATATDHWQNTIKRYETIAPPITITLFRHDGEGQLPWGLDTLVSPPDVYPEGQVGQPLEADFIDEEGDHKAAADAFRFGPYDNRAYSHIIHDESGKLWLQYWFFYYYNEQSVLGIGDHEGDWEMVQYRLTEAGSPEVGTYAQHNDQEAETCPWSKIQPVSLTDPVIGPRNAPIVYVAARSQASYFIPGVHVRPNRPDDIANGNGDERVPTQEMITDNYPSWVHWPGRWGEPGAPASPGNQDKRWSTPDIFDSEAGVCANLNGSPR